MTNTNPTPTNTAADRPVAKSVRLHYLDWLQVLAVFVVFLFHAVHPFDDLVGWHIKNPQPSALANFFVGFFALWGMPFFFLMAGATSWFSLRRRTPGRYVRERVKQLVIPFIIGALVLTPIQAYYELTHKGWWQGGSIVEFILSPEARTYFYTEFHTLTLSAKLFSDVGYHLWFLAFLFLFSLIALPVFLWLKRDAGKRFLEALARLAERPGGLLVFVIPMVVVRAVLQRGFPAEHDTADFAYNLLFFVAGYILIADQRFMRAIRRGWVLYLLLGIPCTLFFFSVAAGVPVSEWIASPGTPMFYVTWAVYGINSWCWTMVVLAFAMRRLDFHSNRLRYFREASFPVFWVHQPVIIFVAFYAVQWEVSLLIKLLVVVMGSFAASLALYELFVRRIDPVRVLFGLKPQQREMPSTEAR
jgi:hypothetical protein